MVTTDGPSHHADIALDGLSFTDARTGRPFGFGDAAGVGVLTVIRHRY